MEEDFVVQAPLVIVKLLGIAHWTTGYKTKLTRRFCVVKGKNSFVFRTDKGVSTLGQIEVKDKLVFLRLRL